MSEYHNFTSLQPHEEAQFVVFERRTQESLQKAFLIGAISSGFVFLVAVGIYFGVEPEKDETAKGMDMSQLKSKEKISKEKAAKEAAEAAPAPAKP